MESANKANLRKQILEARPQSSKGLTENLIRLSFELEAEVIASYWPVGSEPDVSEFNNWVLMLGKTLLTPRVKSDTLEFASGAPAPGAFGILEPQGLVEPLESADLILVPSLAIDAFGNRLGKGKGFYDRALAGVTKPKFGVIFDSEFLDSLPVEDHDLKVNGSVSPSAIRHLYHG